MNAPAQIKWRDARDRLASILGLGVPQPLRDLDLVYVEMTAQGVQAQIEIVGAQRGVTYQLCAEEGEPLADSGGLSIKVPWSAETSEIPIDQRTLSTPAIVADIAYSVLASRADAESGVVLENYLTERVTLKAGINTTLPVWFEKDRTANSRHFDYLDKVTVVVGDTAGLGSQEGVMYRLQDASSEEFLSSEQPGDTRELRFTTKEGVKEDITLRIVARRGESDSEDPPSLEKVLGVFVRPNPDVLFRAEPSILEYETPAQFVLENAQETATYRLFRRPIALDEYVAEGTAGAVSVPTENSRSVFLRLPVRPEGPGLPAGFEQVGEFSIVGGKLTATTSVLQEDAFFIVEARKNANGETLLLKDTAAVLVRPNPRPVVSVGASPLAPGAEGLVIVSGTQKGVRYQLQRVADGADINPPGYHHENRGIEAARLEVDFMVEGNGDERVLLPTGAVNQTTEFQVVATKLRTGLKATLTGRATLAVTAPSTPAPAGGVVPASAPRPGMAQSMTQAAKPAVKPKAKPAKSGAQPAAKTPASGVVLAKPVLKPGAKPVTGQKKVSVPKAEPVVGAPPVPVAAKEPAWRRTKPAVPAAAETPPVPSKAPPAKSRGHHAKSQLQHPAAPRVPVPEVPPSRPPTETVKSKASPSGAKVSRVKPELKRASPRSKSRPAAAGDIKPPSATAKAKKSPAAPKAKPVAHHPPPAPPKTKGSTGRARPARKPPEPRVRPGARKPREPAPLKRPKKKKSPG